MEDVLKSIKNAFVSLLNPRILLLSLIPFAFAFFVWGTVAFLFWGQWFSSLNEVLSHLAVNDWLIKVGMEWLVTSIVLVVLLLLLLPTVFLTAIFISAVVMMPALVRAVSQINYPDLVKKEGGTVWGSTKNTITGVAFFTVLWVLTLPLWLFGPLAAPIPILLSAYLNQKLFSYDALSTHASAEELSHIIEACRGKLYLLGSIAAIALIVPPISFVAPTFTALAFIHLCLAELRKLRS